MYPFSSSYSSLWVNGGTNPTNESNKKVDKWKSQHVDTSWMGNKWIGQQMYRKKKQIDRQTDAPVENWKGYYLEKCTSGEVDR